MGKKNLSSLMNGILGEPENKAAVNNTGVPSSSLAPVEETESSIENNTVVKRNVGRPRKNIGEVRTTFILDPELLRKAKYISLADDRLLKDIVAEALSEYISHWEEQNMKIKLPKNNGSR